MIKVLVVDDSALTRKLFGRVLSDEADDGTGRDIQRDIAERVGIAVPLADASQRYRRPGTRC